MMKWEDLNVYQKTAFWLFIGLVGWFSPEIALLFQFGGIEVVFAFLAVYTIPIIRQVCTFFAKAKYKTKQVMRLAYCTYESSASAKPSVFFVQATFCALAFFITGYIAFAAFFLMPSLLLNGMLV